MGASKGQVKNAVMMIAWFAVLVFLALWALGGPGH